MGIKGFGGGFAAVAPAPPPSNDHPPISHEDFAKEKLELLDEIERLEKHIEALEAAKRPSRNFFSAMFDRQDEDGEPVVSVGCKVSREAVFEAIDTEREHMLNIGHEPKGVGEYLALLQFYLNKALSDWGCYKKPPLDELDQLRKIGALAVACMEAHGAPPRVKSKAHPIPGQPEKHAPR